ncbi:MAG: hypothetical protein CSA81_11550 [Acidobacteria bacterium]|nr:MAG: hypothetical protein CSA81_11550 [Acidobacteriota bacterium]
MKRVYMVTVFTTLDQAQGSLAQSILLAAGIEVFNPNLNTVTVGYGNTVGGMILQVKKTEEQKAIEILKENGFLEN